MVNRGEYAVLWDVDGVLIDSGEQHRRAWEQLAREEHLPYSDAAFWATFGMRNTDIFPRMFGIAGPPERIAALGDRKEAIYRALLAEDAVALPGAKELLAALHAVGYRQALGSSARPPTWRRSSACSISRHCSMRSCRASRWPTANPRPISFSPGRSAWAFAPHTASSSKTRPPGSPPPTLAGCAVWRCAARASPMRPDSTPPTRWSIR